MLNNEPPEDSQTNAPSTLNETDLDQRQANRKSLKRLIIILVAVGLVLGGIVSVGIAITLNKFGLTDTPAQVEQ